MSNTSKSIDKIRWESTQDVSEGVRVLEKEKSI